MQISAPDADSAPAPKRPRGRPAGSKKKPTSSKDASRCPRTAVCRRGRLGCSRTSATPERDAEAAPGTEVSPRGPLHARPQASSFPRKNRNNLVNVTVDSRDASLDFRPLFRPFWPPPLVSRSRAGSDIFGAGPAPPCRSLTTWHFYPTPCRRRLRLPRMSSGGCCGTGTRAWTAGGPHGRRAGADNMAVTQTPPGMTEPAAVVARRRRQR